MAYYSESPVMVLPITILTTGMATHIRLMRTRAQQTAQQPFLLRTYMERGKTRGGSLASFGLAVPVLPPVHDRGT